MITCPAGLVYNEKTGICTWPDEAKKKGCSSEGNISIRYHACNYHNTVTCVEIDMSFFFLKYLLFRGVQVRMSKSK